MKEKNFFNLKDMVLMALFAALTCVLAPLVVPIGPVPISLTNLVIYFSLYVLGWQRATITYIVYLLLGLVGLPVFSGFEGGVGKVAGPTGGYLIGFIFMAIVCGLLMQVKKDKKIVNPTNELTDKPFLDVSISYKKLAEIFANSANCSREYPFSFRNFMILTPISP